MEVTESPLTSTGTFSEELTFEVPQFGERFYYNAEAQNNEGEQAEGNVYSFANSKGVGIIIEEQQLIDITEERML